MDCTEFPYLKICRPAYFVRTTQLLPHPGHALWWLPRPILLLYTSLEMLLSQPYLNYLELLCQAEAGVGVNPAPLLLEPVYPPRHLSCVLHNNTYLIHEKKKNVIEFLIQVN